MSTIKIYKTKITPDRNALVDDLSGYLTSLTPTYENSEFQYIQIEPKKTIKLNIEQEKVGKSIGNYLDIYQDNKHFYYFITKARWKAKNTVELEIGMDTINTFRNDFTFNKKTNITREHKDRIQFVSNSSSGTVSKYVDDGWTWEQYHDEDWRAEVVWDLSETVNKDLYLTYTITFDEAIIVFSQYLDRSTGILTLSLGFQGHDYPREEVHFNWSKPNKYVRNIDFKSEDIKPILYKNPTEDKELYDLSNESWHLVWRSKEDWNTTASSDNSLHAEIWPENDTIVEALNTTNYITPSDLEAGKYYYFIPADYPGENILVLATTESTITPDNPFAQVGEVKAWGNTSSGGISGCVFYLENGDITCQAVFSVWATGSGNAGYGQKYTGNKYLTLSEAFAKYRYSTQKTYNFTKMATFASGTFVLGNDIDITLGSFNSVDRTDSKLIKIIKLPYAPLTISNKDGKLKVDNKYWKYDSNGYFRLSTNNLTTMKSSIVNESFTPFDPIYIRNVTINTNADRNDIYESKLYHSEFYQPMFVYDSFKFMFGLENLNTAENITYYPTIDFNVTTTTNSRFLFQFNDYKTNRAMYDYDKSLVVSRNNEVAIYNSAYLNYLRTGYNYDVKNIEANKGKAVATTVASTFAGIALGAMKGSVGGFAGAIVGAIIGGASGIISNIYSLQQSERSLQEKLDEKANQATTVIGSDDIDILTAYSNNVPKYSIYKPSQELTDLMKDLFYYCGYLEAKQAIPDITSRYWFNYIQCNPVFNEEADTPYQEYLDDIKARYALGVTVYHKNNNTYDWNQVKENWENSLFE